MKDNFIYGTHFFGCGSPINFWGAITPECIDSYFKRFHDQAFNNIIILIPWTAFQRDIENKNLCEKNVRNLKKILDSAKENDLEVIFRIGFLWDSTPTNMFNFERYKKIAIDDQIMDSWIWFIKEIHRIIESHEAYNFSFISWEDFYWPIYRFYQEVSELDVKYDFFEKTGFYEYLKKFSGTDLADCQQNLDHDAWKTMFTEYYDNFILKRIVNISCSSFENLQVEIRVDPEWLPNDSGKTFYDWNPNYYKSDSVILYYHSNIGVDSSITMSEDYAIRHISSLIDRYSPMTNLGQKKPFIDQLNFHDDTYSEWGKVNAGDEYAVRLFRVLKEKTSGYAIWGYEDWRKNIIHNPFFENGLEGWDCSSGHALIDKGISLPPGGEIKQAIPHLQLDEGERSVKFVGYSGGTAAVRIEVKVGHEIQEFDFEVDNKFEKKIQLKEKGPINSISININESCQSNLNIFEVSVLGRSFSQGFSSESGELTKIGKKLVEMQMIQREAP